MKYVEAPEIYDGKGQSLFLAGGITDCPDWQADLVKLLENEDITLLNPRRKNFPIHDPNAALAQITWEHNHLKKPAQSHFGSQKKPFVQ